ncbi:hypothetical protein [Streptomyces sp. enrichment culture]|uniref:hypothetical protein n=1 Tax=Streptomyces sp. enrichment culture TaxID=1795815 RepID=UPI003F54A307
MAIPRRRLRHTGPAAVPPIPPAFEIGAAELCALERVARHAEERLRELSGSPDRIVTAASAAGLVEVLHGRARTARALGRAGVPLLVEEIGAVEAAVLNLESYGGHEAVLCEGYALLDRLARLAGLGPVRRSPTTAGPRSASRTGPGTAGPPGRA